MTLILDNPVAKVFFEAFQGLSFVPAVILLAKHLGA